MSEQETITLKISDIRMPECTQLRESIIPQIVNEYADDMVALAVFPPIEVVFDPQAGDYILVNGWHRVTAAQKSDFTRIDARVIGEGNEQLAQKLAFKANSTNSLRRRQGDREKAITACIAHPDFKEATEDEIAEATGTNRREVFRVRQKVGAIKNPERKRDAEYEAAIKIIRDDNSTLADNISVGIIDLPREEVLRLAAKEDQERKALVPVMAERRLTLKQAERLNLYRPNDENLSLKTYIDFTDRHPQDDEWYFRNRSVLISITINKE